MQSYDFLCAIGDEVTIGGAPRTVASLSVTQDGRRLMYAVTAAGDGAYFDAAPESATARPFYTPVEWVSRFPQDLRVAMAAAALTDPAAKLLWDLTMAATQVDAAHPETVAGVVYLATALPTIATPEVCADALGVSEAEWAAILAQAAQ